MIVKYLFYLLAFYITLSFGKRSLVIIADITGSMRDEVVLLKSHMHSVVNRLQMSSNIDTYIVLPFSDPNIGKPMISSTPEGLINFLNDIEVSYDNTYNDCPENSLAAIEKALEVSNNFSNIFLFTDAPAKDLNKLQSIQSLCRKSQSQVVTFLSGQCSEETGNNVNAYYEIAKSCSGSVFHLDIINLRQLKPFNFMKEIAAVEWSNIKTHTLFMGTKNFNLTLDKYSKDIVVAVSGDYPEMYITSNTNVNPANEIIMETRRSLVKRLLQPELGEYTVEIGSRGQSLVTFYKRKELGFSYGFSLKRPRSLKETSTRPLPDSNSFLMVNLMDDSLELFSLELRTGDEKNILDFEVLPNGAYITQKYFKADKSFQICVHGREKNTNEVINGITKIIFPQVTEQITSRKAAILTTEMNMALVDFMSNLPIYCIVSGSPKPSIWWEDDSGNTIHSEDFLLETPYLYISYTTINNATSNTTVYCKCENSLGSDSSSIQLFVHRDFVFEVLQYPSDTSIDYGNEGKLFCEVNAYPEAKIEWYHNDSLVENTDNIKYVPEEHMLLIENMNLDETGEYRCDITNEAEQRSFTAVVDISGLEAPSIELSQMEYILKPGDEINIECNVVQGNPKPVVAWTKAVDDSKNGYGSDDIPDGVYLDDNSLKISSAKSEHRGSYMCSATNIQGKDSKVISIEIRYEPMMKNADEIKTVKVGDHVELECEVDAVPEARVHWDLYQDDVIIALDDRHRTDERHTHRFTALSQDSGKYHCIAENSMGRAERTVIINVLVPPYIEPLVFKTVTIRAGESLTIICNVSYGNPMPTIRWEFTSPRSTVNVLSRKITTKLDLVLRYVTKKDEGTYKCVAENEVAHDNIKFFLKVT